MRKTEPDCHLQIGMVLVNPALATPKSDNASVAAAKPQTNVTEKELDVCFKASLK